MSKLRLVPKPPARRRHKVRLDAPAAQTVAVTGDFSAWDAEGRPLKRGADGVWEATLLLAPGRYEYRLLVDGQWADDPACPERIWNEFGTQNCVLRVESPAAPVKPLFTKKELDGYRKALSDLEARLDRTLAHDQRELMRADDPDVPGGPLPATADAETDAQQEVELGLIANESNELAEVRAALERIDAGTFGRCENCGKAITRTRLKAVPYARTCVRCASMSQAIAG
ncbi:MAG TPA: TraR/DksA C4-type zinc finger protein [Gemmataceae bacterium]|nr:TraR/DksA C4-type zinc finger protein [Gemmataceae bacterium]